MFITVWPNINADNTGSLGTVSWERLCEFMNDPKPFAGEWNTKGWSCAKFENNHRSIEEVIQVDALCLDFDKGKAPRRVIEALFGRYQYAAHSSKSNTKTEPRYRVVIAISRPVTGAEYYRVWRVFTKGFLDRCDVSTKDPSRFWFVPCKTENTYWEFWANDGAVIDVDKLLIEADEIEKREAESLRIRAEQLRANANTELNGELVLRRASSYLAKMDPAIQGSNGSLALWQVALVLIRGFMLSPSQAATLIELEYNQRCVPPWSNHEIAHKIAHALKASRLKHPDGWLLGNANQQSQSNNLSVESLPDDPIYDGEIIDVKELDAEQQSPEVTAVVEIAKQHNAKEIEQTAAERFNAYSAQRLALDVLTDVSKPKEPGCPIGIQAIDEAMGGIRKQMVGTLGASTSFGKTTLGMLCVNQTCEVSKRPLVLTFEDAPLLYGRKLVAARGGINATRIRNRDLEPDEFRLMTNVIAAAETGPLLINCIGKTVEYAVAAIREIVPSEGIDVVIVDYLQRIRTEKRTQDRRNEVTYVAGSLSDAIKIADCGGLMLSQMKRINGKEPEMDDLKESGDIECFSEFVILGWRNMVDKQDRNGDRYVHEEKWCKLAKSKDGIILLNPMQLKWNTVTASFEYTEFDWKESEYEQQSPRAKQELDDIDGAIGGYYG